MRISDTSNRSPLFQPKVSDGASSYENMRTLNDQAGGRRLSQPSGSSPAARVCMPTWRGVARMAFEAANYEAEDVFTEADHVDLFPLEPGVGFRFREKCQRRLLWRGCDSNAGLRKPRTPAGPAQKGIRLVFLPLPNSSRCDLRERHAGLEGSVQD